MAVNRTDILVGAVAFAVALMIALAVAAWSLLATRPADRRPVLAHPATQERPSPDGIRDASTSTTPDPDRRAATPPVVASEPTTEQPPRPQEGTEELAPVTDDVDPDPTERLAELIVVGTVDTGDDIGIPTTVDRVTETAVVVEGTVEPVSDLLGVVD